mmetsp:Transcript_494/g.554  ORF Transcript_494/g.554 Transcript_494/m.554 type:complete len:204 (+) Transcript_494:99-710(+)
MMYPTGTNKRPYLHQIKLMCFSVALAKKPFVCSTLSPKAIDHVRIRIDDLPNLLPCCTVDIVLFCSTVSVYQSFPSTTRPILRNSKLIYDCGSSSSIVSLSIKGRILKCSPTSPNIGIHALIIVNGFDFDLYPKINDSSCNDIFYSIHISVISTCSNLDILPLTLSRVGGAYSTLNMPSMKALQYSQSSNRYSSLHALGLSRW